MFQNKLTYYILKRLTMNCKYKILFIILIVSKIFFKSQFKTYYELFAIWTRSLTSRGSVPGTSRNLASRQVKSARSRRSQLLSNTDDRSARLQSKLFVKWNQYVKINLAINKELKKFTRIVYCARHEIQYARRRSKANSVYDSIRCS